MGTIVIATLTSTVATIATAMVALIVAAFTFLALAPVISDTWTDRLHSTPNGGPSIDQPASNAD